MSKVCPICGDEIPEREGRGRPQKFCSPACRRASAIAVKGVSEQLSKIEAWASHSRLCKNSTVWQPEEVYDAEIARLQMRLRSLLADADENEA